MPSIGWLFVIAASCGQHVGKIEEPTQVTLAKERSRLGRLSDAELFAVVAAWGSDRSSGVPRSERELSLEGAAQVALAWLAKRRCGAELARLADAYEWDGGGAYDLMNAALGCGPSAIGAFEACKSAFGKRILESLRRGEQPDWPLPEWAK